MMTDREEDGPFGAFILVLFFAAVAAVSLAVSIFVAVGNFEAWRSAPLASQIQFAMALVFLILCTRWTWKAGTLKGQIGCSAVMALSGLFVYTTTVGMVGM